MSKKTILPTSTNDNTPNTSSVNGNGSTRVSTKSNTTTNKPQSKTNCLFVVFAILTFIVSIININFHHTFHDEHVIEKSHREFQQRFQTSRKDVPLVDDYVSKRVDDTDNSNNSSNISQQSDSNSGTGQHKLAGLHCKEKYGGPEDEYAEQEMTFWSDIPSDASYKSPFLDDTERFLTFEP